MPTNEALENEALETRYTIEEIYTVKRGIIVSPGKFQNCPIFAPYYFDLALDGVAGECSFDDNGTYVEILRPSIDERAAFPELYDCDAVVVSQDHNGFVYVQRYNEAELRELVFAIEERNREHEKSELSPYSSTTTEPFPCLHAAQQSAARSVP